MNVKDFIKENIDLIDNEDWKQVYNIAPTKLHKVKQVGELTQILLSCGIHPEDKLRYIPRMFLYGTDVEHFKIPDNISVIKGTAFGMCNKLKTVDMSAKVEEIHSYAFYGCASLTRIDIPKTVIEIGSWAFGGCYSLKDIWYHGTTEDWSRISKGDSYKYEVTNCTVHCTDGDVHL